jgi:hypothetical protein
MNRVALFIILNFCFVSLAFGQRNEISVGTMLASRGRSVIGEYEYRTKALNQKLGIGIRAFYESMIVERNQAAIIPVVNYYFIDRKFGNFYVGIGGAYGYIETLNEGKQNKLDFKAQLGFNVKLYKNLYGFFEYTNLVFDDNFPNPNYGLSFRF